VHRENAHSERNIETERRGEHWETHVIDGDHVKIPGDQHQRQHDMQGGEAQP